MQSQKFLLLPSRLRSLRVSRGLSQKNLAAAMGIAQTRLCAIEKGRATLLKDEVLSRACRKLELRGEQAALLIQAAAHDRLMAEVCRSLRPEGWEFVGLALRAAQCLSPEELGYLQPSLERQVNAKADIQSQILAATRKEVVMT